MRKILKQIFVSGILISGVYCVTVSAKSLGKFTFDIDRAVYGNTGYSIEAKDTWNKIFRWEKSHKKLPNTIKQKGNRWLHKMVT